MNESTRKTITSWIARGSTPAVEEVRTLRRSVMTDSGSEDLAETLLQVEKSLQQGDPNPLDPLEGLLREGMGAGDTLRLRMSTPEPFPEMRWTLLERTVRRFGGRIVSREEEQVTVRMPRLEGICALKGLYNWLETSS